MLVNEVDVREFLSSCTTFPFTLSILSFANDVDNALCSTLPNRYEHIQHIIEQVYSVNISAHLLHSMLSHIKSSTGVGFIMEITHDKTINKELGTYATKSQN